MNHEVPESVEKNGDSVPADNPGVMNHRSSADAESIENGLLVLPDDDHEESIGSPQQSDGFRDESPGGSVQQLRRKGFGLKKWRRIKRDGPVKDEAAASAPVDDGGKLLKRGLTGSVNPPSKHVDLSSVEARQSSEEGSVGSVNMVHHHHHHHHPGLANGFSPDPGFMSFTVGQAFEKGEEHTGGKIVSGNDTIKKSSEDRKKTENEKPCSSLDSDLRSSDFVFSSGAVSVANNGGQVKEEEVQTYSENGENDEDGGSKSKKNNRYWGDKDQIADSIRNLSALQEALWKEVQSFQELGKESIPLHSDIVESCREENSTSSGSQALVLKQKVKHLEHKLEEARSILEAKEDRIQELENLKIESELEGIFQRRIETEILHLVLTSSLDSPLQVLKEPKKKVHSLTEDPEPNRGNMLGKTCKFSLYLLTQLILLVSVLRFMLLQVSPASRLVIPT
ncbi:unnamed protein product [Microthlaspi erraticum]|uniref:Uncharacterized protein n=1 Tax=Microthlaspi erraticum TaxID=1685480 RepID=A0A6D2HKU2_9BRAS|nr:unnamed protein product [Microthlaspi erraticum]CAA7049684.1 unnamed protein product [Microthlaspi erraticum]